MDRMQLLLVAMAPCLGAAAFAGEEAPDEEASSGLEEIIVVAHPLSKEGLAQASDVLGGAELDRKAAGNIGATVGNQPGVHNASFGVALGRPVIHGLDGARVRIMEDRIDTLDVSVTSAEHAVATDPFIANQVEILKGSSTLLYGSGAIGGVVDVQTGRIPNDAFLTGVSGRFDFKAADNGEERNGVFRLDGGVGMLGWHLDGFSRRAGDYDIPGFAASVRELAREEEEEHHDDEEHGEEEEGHHDDEEEEHHEDEEEEFFGVLPASGFEVQGGSGGFSLVGDGFLVGVAVSKLAAEYGIPGHGHEGHGHHEDGEEEHEEGEEEHHEDEEGDHEEEEHGEEGNATGDLDQTRVDFEAVFVDPFPGISSFDLRFAVNDYAHDELEPSGEVGSAFENDAWEARVDVSHEAVAGWEGVVGVQTGDRSFSVVGEEAFVPPVETRNFGMFWVGERSFPGFQLESGVRFDRVEHDPATGANSTFSGVSASLGVVVPLADEWTGTALADYSSRAPVGEELYSNGPHFGARSFELGDASLGEEGAFNLSATLSRRGERWSALGTVYRTAFTDFIFQLPTGEYREGLVVRRFRQADATFTGLDLEASFEVSNWQGGRLELHGMFDTVSATVDLRGNDHLPRIPPARAGLGVAVENGPVSIHVDFMRVFSQEDAADLEFETDGYNDLRAYVCWDVEAGDMSFSVYLQGKNLTDDEQRKHTSLVKDLVPEPGRTIEAGVRIRF